MLKVLKNMYTFLEIICEKTFLENFNYITEMDNSKLFIHILQYCVPNMNTGYLSDRKCYWKPLKILLTTVLTLNMYLVHNCSLCDEHKFTKSMHINTALWALKYHGSCFDLLDTHNNTTAASADTLITQVLQFQKKH